MTKAVVGRTHFLGAREMRHALDIAVNLMNNGRAAYFKFEAKETCLQRSFLTA